MATMDDLEFKVSEAESCLRKLEVSGENTWEFITAFNGFLTSTRSITFALQGVGKQLPGFDNWYANWRNNLRADPLCRHFVQLRNDATHKGNNPIGGGAWYTDSSGQPVRKHYLYDLPEEVKSAAGGIDDALGLAELYFLKLLRVVADFFVVYGNLIDPEKYYTVENIDALEISIEDLEEEQGLPRGWTAGLPAQHRLDDIRGLMRSGIKWMFDEYLEPDSNTFSR